MLAQILDGHSATEVLTAIFHSILFPRLFGAVKPQTFEVLDVTMSRVSDPEIEQLLTEKVDIFWKGIESGANQRGQMIVTFPEKKAKKSWFQDRRHEFNANLALTLLKALNVMLTHTSSERRRTAVPLIKNATGIFPFQIKIAVKVGEVELG
ncbi:hypothetical protein EV702DRAFT_1182358 [Suillus placidus]|uniref:Autophagy-related protein 101 n=1 Tax=Suillus placidus TaxID=48579 RepID=A0A9P6ZHR9_9AGAM|nr:hypothetical protein EV702DRAFT_1182358 [Suillus placidus]